MPKVRVMFSYTLDTIAEPIIYTMSQQFNLITNIRQADLTENRGWIILDLDGDKKNIDTALAWVTSKGVRVDVVED